MNKLAQFSSITTGSSRLIASSQKIAVLVVEDEFLIRMDIADSLERAGFIVHEAGNAREAIAILDKIPDIKAMFTDVDMPGGMDGVKLATFARDRWPLLKIIITSGYRRVTPTEMPAECRFFRQAVQSRQGDHDHPRNDGLLLNCLQERTR